MDTVPDMQKSRLLNESRTPPPKKSSIDRLSSLPDEILQCVFFFLDFFDVIRTSLLSKRWNSVWKSTPYLNFNMDWYLKHNYNRDPPRLEPQQNIWEFIKLSMPFHHKFWEFVNSSLLLRDESEIIEICIYCNRTMTKQPNDLFRVDGWQNVQDHIFGRNFSFSQFKFPRGACENLAVFYLKFPEINTLRVAALFSNLKSLSLRGVCITSDAAKIIFSGACVKLESVLLEDCQLKDVQHIDISAISLKTITIVNICTYQNFWVIDSFDCRLRISAPTLLSFYYVGPVLLRVSLVNVMSLRNITIRLMHVPNRIGIIYNVFEENLLFCPERFIGFNTAKALTLSSLIVKYFCPRYGNTLDTCILDGARHLELEIRYKVSFIEGMLNLLRCSPNIDALFIRLKKVHMPQKKSNEDIENNGNWTSRVEDIACLTYNVKFIQVSNLDGSNTSLELVKFLLHNGKALQKMEIMQKSGERNQLDFSNIMALPRASSEVVISFPGCTQKLIPWFDKGDSDSEFDD